MSTSAFLHPLVPCSLLDCLILEIKYSLPKADSIHQCSTQYSWLYFLSSDGAKQWQLGIARWTSWNGSFRRQQLPHCIFTLLFICSRMVCSSRPHGWGGLCKSWSATVQNSTDVVRPCGRLDGLPALTTPGVGGWRWRLLYQLMNRSPLSVGQLTFTCSFSFKSAGCSSSMSRWSRWSSTRLARVHL